MARSYSHPGSKSRATSGAAQPPCPAHHPAAGGTPGPDYPAPHQRPQPGAMRPGGGGEPAGGGEVGAALPRPRAQGLREARRSGRKPTISDEIKQAIITEATRPPKGFTRWSSRRMARAKGVSADTVQRLWRANDLKPHLKRTFKVSNDPQFEAKFWDVIGLYLHPPERALVLCCDEKSQCQARWSARNGRCLRAPARCAPAPMTTSGTARSRSLRR